MPTFNVSASKAAGNMAFGHGIAFGVKDWCESQNGLLKPLLARDGWMCCHGGGRL